MLLSELLDHTYQYETLFLSNRCRAEFETSDGRQVKFEAATWPSKTWNVEFGIKRTPDAPFHDYDITGGGDAIKIFATIVKIVDEFINHYSPTEFWFSADEASRIKLYDRLSRRMLADNPKYHRIIDEADHTLINLRGPNKKKGIYLFKRLK